MKEENIKFYSHILSRDINLLISGHWGYPILMFPTSMGDYLQNKDFGLLDTVNDLIEAGKIKLYNVESIDFQSFYSKNLPAQTKVFNYNLYTQFLKKELVPAIQSECNVQRIALAGCSFGGYHCTNFAFKNPDLVAHLFSMSGAFSIKSFMKGHYDDNVFFNEPMDFMNYAESWKYNHMNIVLGTSEWDICREDNLKMSRLLANKGINHCYDEKRWASHDWPLWKMMFSEYVRNLPIYS